MFSFALNPTKLSARKESLSTKSDAKGKKKGTVTGTGTGTGTGTSVKQENIDNKASELANKPTESMYEFKVVLEENPKWRVILDVLKVMFVVQCCCLGVTWVE